MRMDQSRGLSAYDIINTLPEEELKRIIKDYG
jgi:16S rRNA C1402 N4-methylase RsmH